MAIGFKIADGYVEVHAEVDEDHVRASARRASSFFDDETRRRSRSSGEDSGKGWFSGFVGWLFKPTHTLSRILPGWFEVAASPIVAAGLAAGVLWVGSFIGAILSSGLMVALGGGFIALAAFALHTNEKLQAEWTKTADVISKSFMRAAQPMLEPFIKALGLIRNSMKDIEPIMTRIFTMLAPTVEPLTKGLIGFATNFLKGIEKAMPAVVEIMNAFSGELPDFGKAIGQFFVILADNKDEIITALHTIFDILNGTIITLAKVIVFFTILFNDIRVAHDKFIELLGDLKFWFTNSLPDALGSFGNFFKNLWNDIVGFFKDLWGGTTDFFAGVWQGIVDFFQGVWNAILGIFAMAWGLFMAAIQPALTGLQALWDSFWGLFGEFFKAIWDLIVAIGRLGMSVLQVIIENSLLGLKNAWNTAWGAFKDNVMMIWNLITQFLSYIWKLISDDFKAIWQGISDFFGMIWGRIGGTVTGAANKVSETLSYAWNRVKQITSEAWNGITSAISNAMSSAWNTVTGTLGRLKNFISDLYNDFRNAARKMIQGIVDGITDMIRKVTDAINRLTQIVRDHLPGSPIKMGALSGDHSPEHGGRKISEMLAAGLLAGIPSVKAALDAIIQPIPTAATPPSGTPPQSQPAFAGTGEGNITINIRGVWDFTDSTAAKKIVAQIHEAIEEHKRGYGLS